MKALVTGGGGFLGTAIVRMLREEGHRVRSVSRSRYPHLERLQAEQLQGDLADAAFAARAAEGCDAVFHVAARAGVWGKESDFVAANVTATANVISACRLHGISRLVYTSSPSVVFDGSDVEGGDESLPYPPRYKAHYPRTKAEGEKMVLQADSPQLSTVALRPHLIWGPGDNHLVPRIVERGRRGRLRRIGSRPCLVDTVYVDNAARAHLLAMERLAPGSPVAGRSYFISNGEPVPLWEMVDAILAAAGEPPVRRSISPGAAYAAGALCEALWRLLPLKGEPPMTRFVARELSSAHWFEISAARRDLGYEPEVSLQEGLRRLKESFSRG